MTELPKNIEDQIEAIWFNAQKKLVEQKIKDIQDVLQNPCTVTEVTNKVEDFNSVINSVCGDDEDLYDMYRFRMFVKDCEVVLLQRPKVVSEVDRLYEVNRTLYNLIDYDEVDVDVRRYGTGESEV